MCCNDSVWVSAVGWVLELRRGTNCIRLDKQLEKRILAKDAYTSFQHCGLTQNSPLGLAYHCMILVALTALLM